MAKRPNPYTEDYVQQSKIHVGLKQFNNNEERLSKVYEKTLEMLFKGAKRLQAQVALNVADRITHETKDHLKQLTISNDGTLTHSNALIENKAVLQHCACGGIPEDSHCGYCEAALCAMCQHLCVRCDNSYCSRCSIVGSDGEMCVSCYG